MICYMEDRTFLDDELFAEDDNELRHKVGEKLTPELEIEYEEPDKGSRD